VDGDFTVAPLEGFEAESFDNSFDRLDDGFLDGKLGDLGLCVRRNLSLRASGR